MAKNGKYPEHSTKLTSGYIMKIRIPSHVGTASLCVVLSSLAVNGDLLSSQVDFGTFSPPKNGGEFVEVNLPSNLIALAGRILEKQEPDIARLVSGLQLVRVNVIGLDEDNRPEIEQRIAKVSKELGAKGWQRIVSAQKEGKEANIFLKMTDKGAVQGLVAMVTDGEEHAVFANIVGEIKPEQISILADKLHIDALKNIGTTEKTQEKSAEHQLEKPSK
jgi:hypothetical protein